MYRLNRTLVICLMGIVALIVVAVTRLWSIQPYLSQLQLILPLAPRQLSRPSPAPSPPAPLTLIATGDIMLGRAVNAAIIKTQDALYPFRPTQELLSQADITLINLENPLTDPCPTGEVGMKFCAPTKTAATLFQVGIDVANLSNNHTKNYGEEGYKSTIAALETTGIQASDADRMAVVGDLGTRFGFVGFDLVSRNLRFDEILDRIKEADEIVDVLIVSFHRGAEYAPQPANEEREQMRLAVDAGADLIIGHHPHVVQPIEIYKNVPIAYSLGNFVFDQMWSQTTREGVVGKFTFTGSKLSDYEFIPVYIDQIGQPKIVTNRDHLTAILSRLARLGYPVQDGNDEDSPEDHTRQ